jgi:hypothetical protein
MCEDIAFDSDCDTEHNFRPGLLEIAHESIKVSFTGERPDLDFPPDTEPLTLPEKPAEEVSSPSPGKKAGPIPPKKIATVTAPPKNKRGKRKNKTNKLAAIFEAKLKE